MAQAPPPPVSSVPHFDRAEVQVVPGATVSVHLSGGSPPYVIVPSSSNFDVDLDAEREVLTVSGRLPGRGTIGVIDSTGASASVPVLVAPPAGVVPAQLSLTLAGPALTPDFAAAQARAAVARAAHLQPGAAVGLSAGAFPALLQPGATLELRLPVTLRGNGAFVDVNGTTVLQLSAVELPPLDPGELMYSDDPENVPAGSDGVLFADAIGAGESARLYLYHTSLVPDRHLTLALRATAGPARVQVLGVAAGPSADYIATGHAATARFLRARRSQASLVVDLEPGAPFLLPLGERALDSGELVAAIFDLRVLSGGPLDVACVATSGADDAAAFLSIPRVAGDGHQRSGTYALDAPPLELAFTVGAGEPPAVAAGAPKVTAIRAPRALGGGYGVVQRLRIALENPTAAPADVYLYEVPNGNALTTSLLFDGEPDLVEVPCVRTAGVRYAIRHFSLAPGQRLEADADYMTDGASSYPVQFGVSSLVPEQPVGCATAPGS